MNRSEQLNELASALAKAQAEMSNPAFDSTNPHFKSKFASLKAVRAAVLPVLNKHGLSVSQFPCSDEGRTGCRSVLLHSSGQFIEETLFVPVSKNDAHGAGSALTYARRYALQAIAGVAAEEDDDGNQAVDTKPGFGHKEHPSRTVMMKCRSNIQEHIANERDLGVLEEWEAAQAFGEEFCSAVWAGLTTDERNYVRKVNNQAKEGKKNGHAVAS